MWPFKNKERVNEESSKDTITIAINKLKEFRDVGETFNYLGRTCIVTGHCDIKYQGIYSTIVIVPLLKFDYCDNYGVLHSCAFKLNELPAVIKQQEALNETT